MGFLSKDAPQVPKRQEAYRIDRAQRQEFYAEYLLPSGAESAIISGIIDKYTIAIFAIRKS